MPNGTQNQFIMNLKEIEREKRAKAAERNLMLAEEKVKLHKKNIEAIEQKGDVKDVRLAADLMFARAELNRAENDLEQAKNAVIEAEADPDVLDEAIKRMGF